MIGSRAEVRRVRDAVAFARQQAARLLQQLRALLSFASGKLIGVEHRSLRKPAVNQRKG